MNKNESLQQIFFKEIKNNLPEHISLVNQISETLNVGTDSAYRRIRGQKQLSFDELEILSKKFDVSVDAIIMNSSDVVACHYDTENSEDKVELHLIQFKNFLKEINEFQDKKVVFEAKDLPISNLLIVPEILAFKRFFWYKVLYQESSYQRTFSEELTDSRVEKYCKETMTELVKIPTVEIWNKATIDTLLNQIRYCYQKGYFKDKNEADFLVEKLHEWVVHLKEQCELGYRSIPGTKTKGRMDTFSLYCTEIVFPSNNILIKKNDNKAVFLVQHDLCMLLTRHQRFCTEMEDWLQTCLETANPISRKNPQEFNRFFNYISTKINEMASEFIS